MTPLGKQWAARASASNATNDIRNACQTKLQRPICKHWQHGHHWGVPGRCPGIRQQCISIYFPPEMSNQDPCPADDIGEPQSSRCMRVNLHGGDIGFLSCSQASLGNLPVTAGRDNTGSLEHSLPVPCLDENPNGRGSMKGACCTHRQWRMSRAQPPAGCLSGAGLWRGP